MGEMGRGLKWHFLFPLVLVIQFGHSRLFFSSVPTGPVLYRKIRFSKLLGIEGEVRHLKRKNSAKERDSELLGNRINHSVLKQEQKRKLSGNTFIYLVASGDGAQALKHVRQALFITSYILLSPCGSWGSNSGHQVWMANTFVLGWSKGLMTFVATLTKSKMLSIFKSMYCHRSILF